MNACLILVHNGLELTKKCIESVVAQDIPTDTLIIDNASTDGTTVWLEDQMRSGTFKGVVSSIYQSPQLGVSRGWNFGLDHLFNHSRLYVGGPDNVRYTPEHVLVINNDTVLPPWFYSSLLGLNLPFVTGVSVDNWEDHPSAWPAPQESPDFSAFLIRRDVWEKIGPFDGNMIHYAGDIDYHLRAKELGIPLMNAGVPFTHKRSSTIRNASPFDREVIERQANADRQAFCKKWGDGYAL